MPQSINLIRGSLLIIITTLCFTAMDAQVKYFSIYTPFIVFVWAKYFGQTVFFSFFFYKNRKRIFEYGNLKLQILRGVCTICPTMGFFLALKYVPLAEATALGFLHPIMVVIASAFILCLILCWNEYFLAALITSTDAKTMPVMVASQISSQSIRWWTMAAVSAALCLPLIIIAIFLERYIVKGMAAGAVKQ